jgi:hypothetical protein
MKDAFKVKKGLNVQPTDPADVVNPEAGDLIVDSTDDNRLKVYDPTSSEFAAVGTGGSSGNILSDIEKLTPTVSNVVAVTDTTTFLPIDDNNKSVKATFSGSDGSIRYEGPASADLDGVQGVVKVWIKTDVEGLSLVATKDGVAQNNGLTVNSSNKWRQYEIPVVLGDADYGFEIQASGTVSGDVYIDEAFVKVNRLIQQFDTSITDWQDYTPIITGGGSAGWSAIEGKYRRVGDSVEINVIALAQANGSGSDVLTFSLPSGLTGDVIKIRGSIGVGREYDMGNGSSVWNVFDVTFNGGSGGLIFQQDGTGGAYVGSMVRSTSQVYFRATIPVVGWSSETSTVVTQQIELTAETANELSAKINSTGVIQTTNYDWIDNIVGSAGDYYIYFKSGIFTVEPSCVATSRWLGSNKVAQIVKGGGTSYVRVYSHVYNSSAATAEEFNIVCTKQGADVNKSATIVGKFENINSSDLCTLEARDVSSAASITAGNPIPFTEVSDNCNAWNGSQYTAPKSGWYKVNGSVRASSSVLQYMDSRINNVDKNLVFASTPANSYLPFSDLVYLNSGEVYHIRSESTFTTVTGSARTHWISIQQMPDTEAIVKNLSDQKVKCQTKSLSANTTVGATGFLSDLQFDNLDTNKYYSLSSRVVNNVNSSAIDNDYLYWRILGFNRTLDYNQQSSNTGNNNSTGSLNAQIIKPTTSTATFQIYAVSSASYIISGSWVEICELPDTYVETTKF